MTRVLADKSNSSAVKLRRKSTAQKSDSFSEDVRQASGGGVGVGVGVRVGGGRGHTVHTNKLVKGVAGRTVTGRTGSRDQRHGG